MPDHRNSGVVKLVSALVGLGIDVTVWDPLCDADAVRLAHGIDVSSFGDLDDFDAIVLAVPASGGTRTRPFTDRSV